MLHFAMGNIHLLAFTGLNRYPLVEELARFGATVHTCSRNEAELGKCLQSGRGWDSMSMDLCVIYLLELSERSWWRKYLPYSKGSSSAQHTCKLNKFFCGILELNVILSIC